VFGFFRKRVREYPSEAHWSVAHGELEGRPFFVRRNATAALLAGHPEYRFRVGVAVPLRGPNSDGLPTNEEMEELNVIEDSLCRCLEREQEALQVLAITTAGMREFVFYARSPALVGPCLTSLRSRITTHELQSYVEEDPKWSLYARFA
jgi:hypothetical protein